MKDDLKQLLFYLEAADAKLTSARSWGWFDMFAGGFISSMVKRGRMDEASEALKTARIYLIELSAKYPTLDLNIPGFDSKKGKVVDIFFDNIFSDATNQNRIEELGSQLKQVIAKVKVEIANI